MGVLPYTPINPESLFLPDITEFALRKAGKRPHINFPLPSVGEGLGEGVL
jgi:hypothetical protein